MLLCFSGIHARNTDYYFCNEVNGANQSKAFNTDFGAGKTDPMVTSTWNFKPYFPGIVLAALAWKNIEEINLLIPSVLTHIFMQNLYVNIGLRFGSFFKHSFRYIISSYNHACTNIVFLLFLSEGHSNVVALEWECWNKFVNEVVVALVMGCTV